MGRLTLVTGGQSSGKTAHAARAADAAAGGGRVLVVAPAEAWDAEMAARIARHRADRPAHWRTVETFDLDRAVADADPEVPVIVDALDTWLVRRAHDVGFDRVELDRDAADAAERSLLEEVDQLAAAVRARPGPCWVVAGQPGLGLVPLGAVTRRHVDVHGRACQRLRSDEVVLLVAGAAFSAPGGPPPSAPPG